MKTLLASFRELKQVVYSWDHGPQNSTLYAHFIVRCNIECGFHEQSSMSTPD